jgi:hypothetical protein
VSYKAAWPGRGLPISATRQEAVSLPGLVLVLVVALALVLLATVVAPAQAHHRIARMRGKCYALGPADTINCVAQRFRLDPAPYIAVARCESGLNRYAHSPSGTYHGLYQYALSSWASARDFAGMGNADHHSGRKQTIVTMRWVVHNGWGWWSCA